MPQATDSAAAAAARPGAARAAVASLTETMHALMRTLEVLRGRFLAAAADAAADDVEWAGHVLLKTLSTHGPVRTSTLAEILRQDASTVSRQVTALVKEGLVERHADPEDGRACLLGLTPAASDRLARHQRAHIDFLEQTLAGWSDDELRRFAADLQRFTDDFQASSTAWLAERLGQRERQRAEHRPRSAEGTSQ